MKSISLRAQLGLVVSGYAAVSMGAAAILYARHLAELQNPAEAAGGMWAAGDAMLWIFIACAYMVPTAMLIWVIAKLEAIYKIYSRLLLGLSLSAPVSLGLFTLGQNHVGEGIGGFCLIRLLCSPLILVGMGVSRVVARFDQTRKLTLYALLIEGLTFATSIALLIHAWVGPGSR